MTKQKIDKAILARKIQDLKGLSKEEKSELTGLLNRRQYGLVWEDKPEAVEERLRSELPVLKEVKERAIISDDPNAPNHILIEGDNLEALVALTYTHAGKIDVIYIDPPYNTGNKDFVYNDSYVDKEDSFRHSKWLSFMSKRLQIAKQLLSDKGVIFISIDDNEQAQLKLLCDEIFGYDKFLGLITRRQSSGSKNDTGENRITTTADYLIAYARDGFMFSPYYVANQKNYTREDDEGKFSPRALEMQGGGDTLVARPKMGYSVYYRERDKAIKLLFDYDLNNDPVYSEPDKELIGQGYKCYRPRKRDMALGIWRWGDDTFMEKFRQNLVHFERGRIFIKERAKDDIPKYPEAIWEDYLNTQGTNELKEIFGGKSFNFPKPVNLIMQMLRVAKGSIILDFFAGSGTTLHATMQLNAEDGGHRQCILVTNNENGICENVTYERNKRVIEGYTTSKGKYVEGLHCNSLRYYKTTFIPRNTTLKNLRNLVASSIELLCIKDNLYDERESFGHIKLDKRRARYFEHGRRRMLLICDETLLYDFIDEIREMELDSKIKVYVFSDSAYAYDDDFEEVFDKVEVCALPAAILAAYKEVLPSREELDADGNFVAEDSELTENDPDLAGNVSSQEEDEEEPFKTTLF